jgi:hypothetical protein
MFKNLVYFVFFCTVLFFSNSISYAFSNDEAEKAYKLYQKSKEKYKKAKKKLDEKGLLKAEKMLLKVMASVPKGTRKLCYSTFEPRVINNDKRWAEFEDVWVEKCIKYYPNRLIGDIRSLVNPGKHKTDTLLNAIKRESQKYPSSSYSDILLRGFKSKVSNEDTFCIIYYFDIQDQNKGNTSVTTPFFISATNMLSETLINRKVELYSCFDSWKEKIGDLSKYAGKIDSSIIDRSYNEKITPDLFKGRTLLLTSGNEITVLLENAIFQALKEIELDKVIVAVVGS